MTFSVAVLLLMEPALAVMFTAPTVNPVAVPVFAPTTATAVLEEFQFTESAFRPISKKAVSGKPPQKTPETS